MKINMWTHHHEHLFLHSVFGFLAVILASACWMGTIGLWYASHADTVTSSDTTTLSAQVGEINNGPVSPPNSGSGGGSSILPTYPPPSLAPPTIPKTPQTIPPPEVPGQGTAAGPGIVAIGNTTEIIQVPGEDPIYVFRTPLPSFSGSINIPNAIITFELHSKQVFRASIITDNLSQWHWQTPVPIASGDHTLSITGFHPGTPELFAEIKIKLRVILDGDTAREKIPFTPLLPAPEPFIPGLMPPTQAVERLTILAQVANESKRIRPGEGVAVRVQLLSPLQGKSLTLPFAYKITNETGNVSSEIKETMTINPGGDFIKLLYTAPNIPHGNYAVTVFAELDNIIAASSDTFFVTGQSMVQLSSGSIDLSTIYLSLMLLGLAFLLIAYFEYRQATRLSQIIHGLTEQDLTKAHLIEVK